MKSYNHKFKWQKLSSKIVYDNNWMTVYEDEVINPAGQQTIYGHVSSKNDAVTIVPIDDDGNTYSVLQTRYITNLTHWECPAGRIDTGDSVIEAAKRELLEEAGLHAGSIQIMANVQVANSMTSFKQAFCLARGVKKVSNKLDPVDGIIEAKKVSFAEVYEMIISGEIVCATSIAAYLMASKYIETKSGGK